MLINNLIKNRNIFYSFVFKSYKFVIYVTSINIRVTLVICEHPGLF